MIKKPKVAAVDVAEAGKRGGEARAANMSEKQRSESARNAAMARWAKKKGKATAASK